MTGAAALLSSTMLRHKVRRVHSSFCVSKYPCQTICWVQILRTKIRVCQIRRVVHSYVMNQRIYNLHRSVPQDTWCTTAALPIFYS